MTKDHKKVKVSVHENDVRTLAQTLYGFVFTRFSAAYMEELENLNACLLEKGPEEVYQALEAIHDTFKSALESIENTSEVLDYFPPPIEVEKDSKKK